MVMLQCTPRNTYIFRTLRACHEMHRPRLLSRPEMAEIHLARN